MSTKRSGPGWGEPQAGQAGRTKSEPPAGGGVAGPRGPLCQGACRRWSRSTPAGPDPREGGWGESWLS